MSEEASQAPARETPIVVIYATFPSPAEAERIGGVLIDERLAACVNILPAVTSLYVWQGRRQRDSEAAAIIKTRRDLARAVAARIKTLHPYEIPAISVLEVSDGHAPFLAWVTAETSSGSGNT